MLIRLFLLLFFTMCAMLAHGQALLPSTHPLIGKVLDRQAKFIDENLALDKVRERRYVFLGEKHDNPAHHALEQRLIRERFKGVQSSSQGRVVFEMLDSSHDKAIAELKPDDSLDQIRTGLNWPAKAGWDWPSYSPLFQEALKNSALAAGNIDRPFISKVYKEGEQVFLNDPRFSTALNPPNALRDYLLDQIFQSHCGMQSRETLTPMLHIQLAKDASMASAMLQTPAAMLVAGGEHVREDTGAPWHLRKQKQDADVLIIQMLEVEENNVDLASYVKKAGKADLYWFTQATEKKDYCAGVKGKAAQ